MQSFIKTHLIWLMIFFMNPIYACVTPGWFCNENSKCCDSKESCQFHPTHKGCTPTSGCGVWVCK